MVNQFPYSDLFDSANIFGITTEPALRMESFAVLTNKSSRQMEMFIKKGNSELDERKNTLMYEKSD